MKGSKFCCLMFAALLATPLFMLAMVPAAAGQEDLKGQWEGEWYSYTKSSSFKMGLFIFKLSPLEGEMYQPAKNPGKPRKHFAYVKGEARDGKVYLNFTGPDGADWKFELALKDGRVLEGDGKTKMGHLTSDVNLRLERR